MLLVEDSADVVDAMRLLFEHNGYRVSSASTVAAAVEVGLEDRPQLVLLDVSLADGEDGLAVLEQWRELGVDIPRVLAITGHSDAVTHERCVAAGCEAVLLKPVRTAELLARAAESK